MLQLQAFPNDAQAWSIGQDRHKTAQAVSADRPAFGAHEGTRATKGTKSGTLAGRLFASTVLRPLCLVATCLLAATYGMAQSLSALAAPC